MAGNRCCCLYTKLSCDWLNCHFICNWTFLLSQTIIVPFGRKGDYLISYIYKTYNKLRTGTTCQKNEHTSGNKAVSCNLLIIQLVLGF